ncbi:MAG: phosphate ABC transporter permease PstA [Myxococcota bacterium]
MTDRVFRIGSAACAWSVLAVLVALVGRVLVDGLGGVSWSLLVDVPADAGRSGGMASILVSTLAVLAIALIVAVPIGLGTAVWLAEFGGRRAPAVRVALDLLATVPSIVHGLFGMAFFSQILGLGWSLASGGLTVAVMIVPLFARLAEEALRAVPDAWRSAGAAAGLDRWQLLGPVILPAALPGLVSALVLSIGRVLAESAALLFTAGTALRMPLGPMDPGRVLALHVYTMAVDVPGGQGRAATAALLLFAVITGTTLFARWAPHRIAAWVRP